MPDPLGDPAGNFSPFAFSRPTVMESLGLLRQSRRTARGEVGIGGMALGDLPPSIRVWVQNSTGADLPTFSVVALSGIIGSIDDADNGSYAFSRAPAFSATTPTATTDAFAILDEPCAYEAGGVGVLRRAVVQGVIPVDVNVTDSGHGYATPTASDNTKLTSATSGPARILYKPAGTGTLRCVVKLDESAAGSSASLTFDEQTLSTHAITTTGAWEDTGLSISLPSAGTYLVYVKVVGVAILSPSTVGVGAAATDEAWIAVAITTTTGTVLSGAGTKVCSLEAPAEHSRRSAAFSKILTVASPTTYQLRAWRSNPYDLANGQSWVQTAIETNFAFGPTNDSRMGYLKIA